MLVMVVTIQVILKNAGVSATSVPDESIGLEKTYNIQPFSSLVVIGAIDLEYIPGDSLKFSVVGGQQNIEKLKINSSDDRLTIECTNIHGNFIKCVLNSPVFTSLEVTAGARFRSDSLFSVNELNISSEAGSSVLINGMFNDIKVESNAGSSVLLTGKAVSAIFEANAGARINAKEFIVENATVEANAGALVVVNSAKITAKANAGATIRYNSIAVLSSVNTSSGGSISAY